MDLLASNESKLAEIYDQTTTIIKSLEEVKANVVNADGLVNPGTIANLTMAKNASLTALFSLSNLQLNMTTSDQDLAENFINDLTDAEEMIGQFVEVIVNHKTMPPSTTTAQKPVFKRQVALDEVLKVLFERVEKRSKKSIDV